MAMCSHMILNDDVPSEVLLFGENPWAGQARELFVATLPFATIVSTLQVVRQVQPVGVYRMVELAQRDWFVRI